MKMMELKNLQPKNEKDIAIAMSIDECIITSSAEEVVDTNVVEELYPEQDINVISSKVE